MKREQFEAMVRRLEQTAAKDPGGYRLRVGLLAALGYGFVLLVLLGVLGLLGGIVALMVFSHRVNSIEIKGLVFLGIIAIAILRALYVRFEAPEGLKLTRSDALPLFQEVDRMTKALGAPRFHHILLDTEFNAAVAQHPRLGVFGWQENYLLVGLPLMQALSPEQFQSVVAHELGHLRGGHGRFGAWIYRVSETWDRLLQQLGEEKAAGALLRAFFQWYAPFFAAYSFALRRLDEYEADRCAANLTSARTAADALCLLPVQIGHQEERYWKPIKQSIKEAAMPPANAFTGIVSLRPADALTDGETAEKTLRDALAEETGIGDTHPSLADRLKSLRQEPRLPEPPDRTAAESFFGPNLARLASQLDANWQRSMAPAWQQAHARTVQDRHELATLDAKLTSGIGLTPQEAMDHADKVEDYRSPEEASRLFWEITQRSDAAAVADGRLVAAAHFHVGRILLDKGDANGIAYIEEAKRRDRSITMPCLKLLHHYHKKQGDEEKAREIYHTAMGHSEQEDAAVGIK